MQMTRANAVLGVMLFLSLAANVFMAGVVAGRGVSPHEQAITEWAARDAALKAKLSDADRAVLKNVMQRNVDNFRQMREQLEGLRRNIGTVVHSPDIDQQALDAAMQAEAEKRKQIFSLMLQTRQQVLQNLSDQGRTIIMQMMPPPHPHAPSQQNVSAHDADMPPFIWEEVF